MRPGVRAVMGDEDRSITDDLYSPVICITAKIVPLPEKQELVVFLFLNSVSMFLGKKIKTLPVPVPIY